MIIVQENYQKQTKYNEPFKQVGDQAIASLCAALATPSSKGRSRMASAKMQQNRARACTARAIGRGGVPQNLNLITTNNNDNDNTKHTGHKRHERPELPPEDEQPRSKTPRRDGIG